MIGAKQFTKRIQHRLNEIGGSPFKRQWQVTLLYNDGSEVKCLPGDTIEEALNKAEELVGVCYPGKTL